MPLKKTALHSRTNLGKSAQENNSWKKTLAKKDFFLCFLSSATKIWKFSNRRFRTNILPLIQRTERMILSKRISQCDLRITLSIIEKLDIVHETTKRLGEIVKKSDVENDDIQTLAIEKIRNDIQPVVQYDTALENTQSIMKKQKRFFEIEERANGDLSWKIIPIEVLGDSTIKTNDDDVYDISKNLRISLLMQLTKH